MNRRNFLSWLGGVVALISAPGLAARAARRLGALERTDFEARLGEQFWLRDATGRRTALRLVEAADVPVRGAWPLPRRPFSVLFRAADGETLPQGTYRLSHPALGDVDLLLVPIVSDGPGRVLQAVFA
jgi:hypothetical protein